jgi:hypothetical protein
MLTKPPVASDAVVAYLMKQGVPAPQAELLAKSLSSGAQDDLDIQPLALSDVADRELSRIRAIDRYSRLEQMANSGAKLRPQDEQFVAAVRNRHKQLIQERAAQTEQDAMTGVADREQGRLQHMQAYAVDPASRTMSPDGSRTVWNGEAHGEPAYRDAPVMEKALAKIDQQGGVRPQVKPSGPITAAVRGAVDTSMAEGQRPGQKVKMPVTDMDIGAAQVQPLGVAKTAAAISQQFGIPPDAAAQLAANLHGQPPPEPDPTGEYSNLKYFGGLPQGRVR